LLFIVRKAHLNSVYGTFTNFGVLGQGVSPMAFFVRNTGPQATFNVWHRWKKVVQMHPNTSLPVADYGVVQRIGLPSFIYPQPEGIIE
jgi:hypothetical protein